MKLLLNENIPAASSQLLKAEGFDTISIGEGFKGVSDREVIELAIVEERTIITFDRDYGELIFRYGFKPSAGVIYLRWKQFQPDEPGKYLAALLKAKSVDFSNALTVIGEANI